MVERDAEFACLRDAEERIRNRLAQLRRIPAAAEREQLPRERRIDLVDVDVARRAVVGAAVPDVAAGRADVADA